MENNWTQSFRNKFDGYLPDIPIPAYDFQLRQHPAAITWIVVLIAVAAMVSTIILLPGIRDNSRLRNHADRCIAEASPIIKGTTDWTCWTTKSALPLDVYRQPVAPEVFNMDVPAHEENNDSDVETKVNPFNTSVIMYDPDSSAIRIHDCLSEPTESSDEGLHDKSLHKPGNRFSAQFILAPNLVKSPLGPVQVIGLPDLVPDEIKDVSFKKSYKAGVSFNYRLLPRLSIESGLLYSKHTVHQRYSDTNGFVSETQIMQLHYLGLPLKLNLIALKKEKLEFYGTAGCVFSWLVTGMSKAQSDILLRDSQIAGNPLLLSIIGGMGLSYCFIPSWSIYIEPMVTYDFMPSRQIDYYQNHPLSFDIALGMRLKLPAH